MFYHTHTPFRKGVATSVRLCTPKTAQRGCVEDVGESVLCVEGVGESVLCVEGVGESVSCVEDVGGSAESPCVGRGGSV